MTRNRNVSPQPRPAGCHVPSRAPPNPSSPRRAFLRAALAAAFGLTLAPSASAQDDKPGSGERPKPGDLLVFAEDDHAGRTVMPAHLALGEPPVLVWPMDPATRVVRDGSRLNTVLLLRLDPASLDEDTQSHAADGIIAYSAICTHAGCPVTGWVEEAGQPMLKCFCHNSAYDPRHQGIVVLGPAPHHLAVLPLKIVDGALAVAGKFVGRVGPTQSG